MLIRIFVGLALVIFACGFTWFMAQVIYLGIKEFFKIHGKSASTSTATAASATGSSTAPVIP